MISERLKSELAELRAKVLDLRPTETYSPEQFACICVAVKNLQSVLLEMLQHEAAATHLAAPLEAAPAVAGSNSAA